MSMDMDKQMPQMQEKMKAMQGKMDKIRKTTDPKERQKLMQDHMQAMQENMKPMHGMGGPMMGRGQSGGIGVFLLVQMGYAKFHVKPADLLAITLGAGLFGIGTVLYGYCPGTALAAIGAGSVHALIGAFGMILGGILYALRFDWVSQAILPVWAVGKVQLPQLFGVGAPVVFVVLGLLVIAFFVILERRSAKFLNG